MYLERVTLTNFRNYQKQSFLLSPASLIAAPNGSGKSNLLEAIYLLSTGVSNRASRIEEMIRFGQESASVVGVIKNQDGSYTELTVVLTRGVLSGKAVPKRRYLVDGVARNRANFAGKLATILFAPEDMRLIEGSRDRRRKYLDQILVQAHPEYGRALLAYEATLKRRNRLLDQIREGQAKRTELAYWDQSLTKNGNILTDYRRSFIEYLNERVKVTYGEYRVDYLASIVSPARLGEYAVAEVAVGYTLVGPHKDDFVINEREGETTENLMTYGSRGEQRLGVLYLKNGATKYLESTLGVKAVVLLDDVFSELDEGHREEVMKYGHDHQMVVTTAEANLGISVASLRRVEIKFEG